MFHQTGQRALRVRNAQILYLEGPTGGPGLVGKRVTLTLMLPLTAAPRRVPPGDDNVVNGITPGIRLRLKWAIFPEDPS
jgi:hypothetical protein